MTSAINNFKKYDDTSQELAQRIHKSSSKEHTFSKNKSPSIILETFKQMELNQKIPGNYIKDTKAENLRKNFISWLFLIAPRIDISKDTIFNTISMVDNLFSTIKTDEIYEPRNFQLLSVTCFFISYKIFEKKKITISFLEKSLLHGKWSQDDIRRAEIFVLESLDYRIHLDNFYSFYKFFEIIIKTHFEDSKVEQIQYLVYYIMQKSLKLQEFMFKITPLEQIIIILNTVFLVLQQLVKIEIEKYSSFFIELTNITAKNQFTEFEKFSTLLINNLAFTEDFIEKFHKVYC